MGFWKQNAGKVSLAAVLFIAAAVMFWYNFRGGKSPVSDDLKYVCVATGKMFTIPRGGPPRVLPIENPDTHERTLVPCFERDGVWFVSDRNRATVREMGDKNKMVDLSTMQVRVSK